MKDYMEEQLWLGRFWPFIKIFSWADFDILESNYLAIFVHENKKRFHRRFFSLNACSALGCPQKKVRSLVRNYPSGFHRLVSHQNMAKYAKYAYLGAYLGTGSMVMWGVPEKILQNAVRTRWS